MAALSRRSYNLLKPITTTTLPYTSHLHRSFSTDPTPFTVETSIPFTSHNCEPPSRSVETSAAELMTFFNDMSKMRRMEIAADSLYKSKLIRGFCHLYDGQEAVAIGIFYSLLLVFSISCYWYFLFLCIIVYTICSKNI